MGWNNEGHEHGLWQTWSPTLTDITLGNASQIARYTQIGKTVHLFYSLDFGSTTTIDGNDVRISLPVESNISANNLVRNVLGMTKLVDAGTDTFYGDVRLETTTTMRILVWDSSGSHLSSVAVDASTPHTWSTDDRIVVIATYEAA